MGFFKRLKKLLRHESAIQSNQSIIQSTIESPINHSINDSIIQSISEKEKPIELQKDSLQLGIAAGYTGKFIKEVESSLSRIESHMVTKDWFTSQFEDNTPELVELLKEHDEKQEKRFETIQSLIQSLQKTAEKVPEPIKTELFGQLKAVEAELPLTQKMRDVLKAVKEAGEINYTDLAAKLNITEDALRGLLSNTMRRTDKIQRFRRNGKGWVHFVGDSIIQSITNQSENQ
jgi:type I site-specific restriction endonuclease